MKIRLIRGLKIYTGQHLKMEFFVTLFLRALDINKSKHENTMPDRAHLTLYE